jgi:C4-dicarboxylate-specific signal transduction histidine kinase
MDSKLLNDTQYFDQIKMYSKHLIIAFVVGTLGPILISKYLISEIQIQFYFFIIVIGSFGLVTKFAGLPIISGIATTLLLLPTATNLVFWSELEGSLLISIAITIFWILGIGQSLLHFNYQFEFQQKTLEPRDHRIAGFVNAIPGLVIWVDSDLRFQDVNANYLTLIQNKKEFLIGKALETTNTPPLIFGELKKFIDSQQFSSTVEIEINQPEKTLIFLCVFTKLRNGDDTTYSIMAIDITDIKNTEHELESNRLQLIENEKMISLGQMAGSIAHEVNNPLAIITGKAHVMVHKIDHHQADMPILREYAKHIYDTAFRIKKIIESLRLLANEGRIGKTDGYTVKDIIQPVLDITQSKIVSQQIEIRLEHETPDVLVNCGLIEMGQVLMNLIVNAIHAIEVFDSDKWIKIHTRVDNDRVIVRFSDCGSGIPEDVQKKLFTPFFTTKGLERGTGIGLSLSRKLIQKQGGELYYDPKSANTTFVIELALAKKSIQNAS